MNIYTVVSGMLKARCYIVACEETKNAVVIDPGSKVQEIIDILKPNTYQINYILNTHYHADHTCGNAELQKKTNAPIMIHSSEVNTLKKIFRQDKISTLSFSAVSSADSALEDGMKLSCGNLVFEVIHTPGHSPGGVCFYIKSEKVLFTGDTLFVGDSGATIFPDSNRTILGESLRKIFSSFPEDTIIYPGHDLGNGAVSTLLDERKTNVNAREYGFFMK